MIDRNDARVNNETSEDKKSNNDDGNKQHFQER